MQSSRFYYEEPLTKRGYTDIPRGEIDPTRLLAQLPAFIAPVVSTTDSRKPKTIILRYSANRPTKETEYCLLLAFLKMTNAGFKLYYQQNSILQAFDGYYSFGNSDHTPELPLAVISKQLDIPLSSY